MQLFNLLKLLLQFCSLGRTGFWLLLFSAAGLSSCKKYLEAKPDASLATPTSLQDLQQLLDNYNTMNNNYPPLAEVMGDNYYLTTKDWSAISSAFYRNMYIWQRDDENSSSYESPHMAIQRCNLVLDLLPGIEGSDAQKGVIRGSALMIRAAYWYGLAQLYVPPYSQATAASPYGLPLRLNSDYAPPSKRVTVAATYNQIQEDLRMAASLLPKSQGLKTRPSKPAAYGWLARTCLLMQQYDQALYYADSCLQLYDSLINFNTLNAGATAPLSRFNKEVIYHLRGFTALPLAPTRAKVDSMLFQSYAANDLRKVVYFKSNGNGTFAFKGDYDGSGSSSGYVFGGIVTDEMYLIRAECYARTGLTELAMKDLNTLLASRWKTGTFVPLTASTPAAALSLVLAERRKELLGRGTRWSDLRRFSGDPSMAVVPRRLLGQDLYELPPNSPRYTIPLPQKVIDLTGMPQNP